MHRLPETVQGKWFTAESYEQSNKRIGLEDLGLAASSSSKSEKRYELNCMFIQIFLEFW